MVYWKFASLIFSLVFCTSNVFSSSQKPSGGKNDSTRDVFGETSRQHNILPEIPTVHRSMKGPIGKAPKTIGKDQKALMSGAHEIVSQAQKETII